MRHDPDRAGAAGAAVRRPADFRPLHALQGDSFCRHGDPGALHGLHLGLWRHPLLRAIGVLRPRRLQLCHRGGQLRREHGALPAGDHRARRLRRPAGLLHVLWPPQRRLSRRGDAGGHAHPLQLHALDGGRGIRHRRAAAHGLQRHLVGPAHQLAGGRQRAPLPRRDIPSLDGVSHSVLRRLEAPQPLPFRAGCRRDSGERAARRAARLRCSPAQATDLHHRRRHGRARRVPRRQFQLLRQPGCVRPQLRGRDHHVDVDWRARHPGRADDRLYRASDAKVRDRPAADHQHLPDFRRDHYGIRAVVPAGLLPTARQLADRFVPGMRDGNGAGERAREAAQ